MRKLFLSALGALFGLGIGAAHAAGGVSIPSQTWSFSGPFGKFDLAASQRGLQVYRAVCAGCHSLDLIAFRNLAALGYGEDEIKAFAAEAEVEDGPDDEGEMFTRPGLPSDYFPAPFPNPQAAAASNGGAIPPDLSLITKARKGGPDYLYALLTGYADIPEDWQDVEEFAYLKCPEGDENCQAFELMEGLSFNHYFPGHQIAMAPPLFEDAVEYADGTPATVEQMAHDVTNFLVWAASPEMEVRKGMGIKVMIFLIVFCVVLYAAKRKIWADVH